MNYEGKKDSKSKEKRLKWKDKKNKKDESSNEIKVEESNEGKIENKENNKTNVINVTPVIDDKVFTVETTQEIQPQWSGRRNKRKFITKNGQVIHADVNGAYNIIRKVLNDFKYEPDKINLNHRLLYLSSQGKGKHRFQPFSRAGIP